MSRIKRVGAALVLVAFSGVGYSTLAQAGDRPDVTVRIGSGYWGVAVSDRDRWHRGYRYAPRAPRYYGYPGYGRAPFVRPYAQGYRGGYRDRAWNDRWPRSSWDRRDGWDRRGGWDRGDGWRVRGDRRRHYDDDCD